jgi:hypothetical protein
MRRAMQSGATQRQQRLANAHGLAGHTKEKQYDS